jgi:peptidoglycan/xylan/chitin deacetylase (PgdA/CDA1 family)
MTSAADLVYRAAGRVTAPGGPSGYLTILLYHRVLAEPDALMPLDFDAPLFDGQMAALASVFHVLPLEEALARLSAGTLPARAVCITFDDGYRDNLEVACPILRRHGLPATFFIASGFLNGGRMFHDTAVEAVRRFPSGDIDLTPFGLGWRKIDGIESRRSVMDALVKAIKYLSLEDRIELSDRLASMAQSPLPADLMMTSEQVRELRGLGMTVGGHTHDHPILAKVSTELARSQIETNRDYLTTLLGEKPRLFAYPNGKPVTDYNEEHVRLVKEAGYKGAVSVAFGAATQKSDPFEVPRIVPWDRSPGRFTVRLLTYALRNRLRLNAPSAVRDY